MSQSVRCRCPANGPQIIGDDGEGNEGNNEEDDDDDSDSVVIITSHAGAADGLAPNCGLANNFASTEPTASNDISAMAIMSNHGNSNNSSMNFSGFPNIGYPSDQMQMMMAMQNGMGGSFGAYPMMGEWRECSGGTFSLLRHLLTITQAWAWAWAWTLWHSKTCTTT